MKLTKATQAELLEAILTLEKGKAIDFCYDVEENDAQEYTEDDGIGWYVADKTSFYDSDIIMIGGYGGYTVCVNDNEYGRADLPNVLNDFFVGEGVGDSCYYCVRDK